MGELLKHLLFFFFKEKNVSGENALPFCDCV